MSSGSWQIGTVLRTLSCLRVDQGDGTVAPVTDHDGCAVGRNPRQSRRSAHPDIAQHQPLFQIQHRNVGRPGIRDIGAFAVRRHIDEVRSGVHADGGDYFIAFRINHADAVRLRIHHIDFVFPAVGGNAGWIAPHPYGRGRLKGAQINHRNRIALAVGNVGVLAVGGAVAGQLAFLEVPPAQAASGSQSDCKKKKFFQAEWADDSSYCRTAPAGFQKSGAWVPMAGTIRPTTGAICRTCLISSSNCSG